MLLPAGIPDAWRGVIRGPRPPVGPVVTVSFAVRWHGEHPAVLWEVTGDPVELHRPRRRPDLADASRPGRDPLAPTPLTWFGPLSDRAAEGDVDEAVGEVAVDGAPVSRWR